MFKKPLALVALSVLTLSANAALYDRGNGLIYDDVLDITWLQDANYAYTSGYAATNAVGIEGYLANNIQADGRMGWDAAIAWAAQLSYAGYSEWRLPSTRGVTSSSGGWYVTTSEIGHMYFSNLGARDYLAGQPSLCFPSCLDDAVYEHPVTGTTIHILNFYLNQQSDWWYGEEYSSTQAYNLSAHAGFHDWLYKDQSFYAWAVADGDIGAVPIPAAAWLFGSALAGLFGVGRMRKKAAQLSNNKLY